MLPLYLHCSKCIWFFHYDRLIHSALLFPLAVQAVYWQLLHFWHHHLQLFHLFTFSRTNCLSFLQGLLSLFCMPLCPVESICNLRILISHLYEVVVRRPAGTTTKIIYFSLFERNVRFLYSSYTSTQHLK